MFAGVKHAQLRVLLVAGLIATVSGKAMPAEPAAQSAKDPSVDKALLAESYGKLPLTFEANIGQTDRRVQFISRGSGYGLFLTGNQAVLALNRAECGWQPAAWKQRAGHPANHADCVHDRDVITMRLAGRAAASVNPVGEEQLPGVTNYFVGSDPVAWRSAVPTFAKVRYGAVYPGVDLVYYGNQKQLEYDFAIAPHADPRPIRLEFSGVTQLRLDEAGNLILSAKNGDIAFHKPVVYQEQNGHRQLIDGHFTLGRRHTVGFSLSGYDHSQPLIIDPVLAYSTYLGGSGKDGDEALAIAVDASGDAYITGQTDSTNFPLTSGSYQQTNQGAASSTYNAFVTKLNSTGSALVYSTYLGGSGNTQGAALAVDSSGNAYIAGHTFATNFPTTSGAYQATSPGCTGCYTAFVTKLNATGTALIYSTYLGGSGNSNGSGTGDIAYALALDSSNDVFVAGSAQSSNFPVTSGAYQTTNQAAGNNASNAFVTELNPAGGALVFSTYLGGGGQFDGGDAAYALAIGGSGIYVTGSAGSSDFPVTAGAYQTTNPASAKEQTAAFVTELNPTGTALVYSTYLGGSEDAAGAALAVDFSGDAYVAGYAMSTTFPVTAGAFQTTNNAAAIDATTGFVTKLNPTGTALLYSTLLGGSGVSITTYNTEGDSADGLAVDASGDAYVTGVTYSSNFPVTSGAIESTNRGAANDSFVAFVTELNPAGTAEVYSTYLGGSGTPFGLEGYYRGDDATGLALDSSDNVYIAGAAYSANFPVTSGAFQSSNLAASSSGSNAFVSKISMGNSTTTTATTTSLTSSANPANAGVAVTFTADVEASSGSAVPTGSVVFTIDGTAKPAATLNGSGAATYATSSLAVGSHTISAAYEGTSSFASSNSNSLTQTITESTAATPTFSLAPGTYFSNQSVTISDATSGATIYYTTNGTMPTTASTKYTAAISMNTPKTIEAIAVAAGSNNSPVASAAYIVNPPAVATPKFSLAGGTYAPTLSVTISDGNSGATIYYTTNGITPTTSSTMYTGAVSVSATETLEAIAVAACSSNSAVASATYTIAASAAAPAFSLAAGSYTSAQSVTLSDATSGATIYYTLNGTTPTTSSARYTGAIPVSTTQTIKAIAIASGYTKSAVASSKYTVTSSGSSTTKQGGTL